MSPIRRVLERSAVVLAAACLAFPSNAQPPLPTTLQQGMEGLNSTLWMEKAPEYAFNAEQTYRLATTRLAAAYKGGNALVPAEQLSRSAGKRPAIVLDLDETVLDNGPFQANVVLRDREYAPKNWDAWSALEAAELIPGAKVFLWKAKRMGFRIFYVSNRECPKEGAPVKYPNTACAERQHTAAVLKKHGLPFADDPSALMLRNDQADWYAKAPRRLEIAKRYRIAMLIGDDLGDFMPEAEEQALHDSVVPGKLVTAVAADPASLYNRYAPHFGRDWFILPNPTYGSWERSQGSRPACAAANPPLRGDACYDAALARKRSQLVPAPRP